MNVNVVKGDLFGPVGFQAIGHGVNTKGLMGAGIAAQFRKRHPRMYDRYNLRCKLGLLKPGDSWHWQAVGQSIYNIASQDLPGANATYMWLGQGMYHTLEDMVERGTHHLGIPWIGCGIGGLRQEAALRAIKAVAAEFPQIDITIMEL